MNLLLLLIPFISSITGWLLASVAMKLFFHPRQQQQLVTKLATLLKPELLSSDFKQKIAHPANIEKLMPVLEEHIDIFLREKLTAQIPMLSLVIGDKTIGMVKAVFLEELRQLFPIVMEQYVNRLEQEFDLESILVARLQSISSEKLQQTFVQIILPEQRRVKFIGAVLGFIIGLLQVLLTLIAA